MHVDGFGRRPKVPTAIFGVCSSQRNQRYTVTMPWRDALLARMLLRKVAFFLLF
jgi:hypothetical protein